MTSAHFGAPGMLPVDMSCQDDLSQLMPSLYSRVKLAYGSDRTADLVQYTTDRASLVNDFNGVLPSSDEPRLDCEGVVTEQQQLQPLLYINRRLQQGAQRKGTGRAVAHRAFHLELRCNCLLYLQTT